MPHARYTASRNDKVVQFQCPSDSNRQGELDILTKPLIISALLGGPTFASQQDATSSRTFNSARGHIELHLLVGEGASAVNCR